MSTSYPLYICCREFPGVPRGDYLLATGARCSPKPRRMTFAGGCSPMLSRMELPGDYLRATGARCSPVAADEWLSPGDYLRARGARCSPGGRLQIQKRKAARRSFFMAVLQKKKLACFSVILPQKKDTDVVRVFAFLELAERGGFEPPEPIRVQRFSRPPRSTAPASLRSFRGQGLWFGSEAEICRQRQTRWYIPASLRGWQR